MDMVAPLALFMMGGMPFLLWYTCYGDGSWWLPIPYAIACAIVHNIKLKVERGEFTEEQFNQEVNRTLYPQMSLGLLACLASLQWCPETQRLAIYAIVVSIY